MIVLTSVRITYNFTQNLFNNCKEHYHTYMWQGAWVAQSVKRPALAQVMIWWFTSWSPEGGSVLTAQSLEPALDSLTPSLSAPPRLACALSLSKINVNKNLF